MGFINNDNYVCRNGVEKMGTYISFAMEMINIKQNIAVPADSFIPFVSSYSITSNYRVYWDKSCRDLNKSPIDTQSISMNISSDQLNDNIYTVLYNELKKTYTNYMDEIVNEVPVAPAVTDAPVVADVPVVTDAPVVADVPAVTDAPVVADVPAVSDA